MNECDATKIFGIGVVAALTTAGVFEVHRQGRLEFVKNDRVFTREQVAKHGKGSERIWVTYKNNVYDITEFIDSHPGGEKILLAAGSAVDPFWQIYAKHKDSGVLQILEEFRIGRLDEDSVNKEQQDDSFSNDPPRHPALLVRSQKPFNAETPPTFILDHFFTPNELFFVRNHMPVPKTDRKTHKLEVHSTNGKKTQLSVDELKNKFKAYTIGSVIQCAGNRRFEMNQYKKVQGLMWEGTAISNAKWTGARLRDILEDAGIDVFDPKIKHIQFEGADKDPLTGAAYGASIPIEKARNDETIVAYEMNGDNIPEDHGAPLRLIVPGHVGARQVKWLTKIVPSEEESDTHWQRKDYRAFPPSVNQGDELNWQSVPSIQESPVQCVICNLRPNQKIDKSDGSITISGYAWSGGGRGIIRVEVSLDGGKTWKSAELQQDKEQDLDHMWSWTFFTTELKIPRDAKNLEIVAKATDRAYNSQPDTPAGIWNIRGLLHNAWQRVPVKLTDPREF